MTPPCSRPIPATKGCSVDFSEVRRNLEKNRFVVSCFSDCESASRHLEEAVEKEVVGFGGSVTLRDMGLYERLAGKNTVLWHWVDKTARSRYSELTAYVTSANAIAETGEIVNMESSGNRVSGSLFGPKKVFFVAGRNKVCPDLSSAIRRARTVASPLNARRLDVPTPCVADGICHDCDSPSRICCAINIQMRPIMNIEHTEVILIDQELGL